MVTVLVGHNDICGHACERVHFFNDPVKNASPSAYIFNVRTALDILHKQLPRTFVNLMAVAGECMPLPSNPVVFAKGASYE